MKNKVTFTLQYIGGDRFYVKSVNNLNGNESSSPYPLSLADALDFIKRKSEESNEQANL